MSTKIAKWYMVCSAALALLMLGAGIVLGQPNAWTSGGGTPTHYWLFTLFPLGAAVVSLLLAWILARSGAKTQTEEKEGGVAAFYKAHLYLWTITALGVAGCGLLAGTHYLYFPGEVLPDVLIVAGLLWMGVMMVGAVVWAAFNAWRSSEILGVVLGIIAVAMLGGAGALAAGYSYHRINNYDQVYAQNWEGYNPEYAGDDECDPVEYDGDGEADYGLAYRFLLDRMRVNDGGQDPEDMLRRWESNGWAEDDYRNFEDKYADYEDFDITRSVFYATYSHCAADITALSDLSDYMQTDSFSFPSRQAYKKSGAAVLVHALLASWDDIHGTENADQTIEAIHQVMTLTADVSADVVPDFYFPRLRDYITESSYADICRKAGFEQDSYSAKYVAGWAYSFWARRHNEGTDQIAHNILKMVDNFY
ncbi:MAG: hypothetical protein LBU95_05850 [Rikenellaceae bacterium]|jgi:hypothetical protein|nr:hypothetical protein [Rikenellaceae bacterium]